MTTKMYPIKGQLLVGFILVVLGQCSEIGHWEVPSPWNAQHNVFQPAAQRRNPRQAYISFLPFTLPQTPYVHQIILQLPNQQCTPSTNDRRPEFPRAPPTREPPPAEDGLDSRFGNEASPKEPSRCTWAIVSCCAPGSRNIRYTCFELLGCPGAFWDVNPCDTKVTMAAANTVLQFYMTNSTASPPSNSLDNNNFA